MQWAVGSGQFRIRLGKVVELTILLHTAYYSLPAAYCLLLTAHCLLIHHKLTGLGFLGSE